MEHLGTKHVSVGEGSINIFDLTRAQLRHIPGPEQTLYNPKDSDHFYYKEIITNTGGLVIFYTKNYPDKKGGSTNARPTLKAAMQKKKLQRRVTRHPVEILNAEI